MSVKYDMRDDIKIMTRRDLTWTMVEVYLISVTCYWMGYLLLVVPAFGFYTMTPFYVP